MGVFWKLPIKFLAVEPHWDISRIVAAISSIEISPEGRDHENSINWLCCKLQNALPMFYSPTRIYGHLRQVDRSRKSVIRPICDIELERYKVRVAWRVTREARYPRRMRGPVPILCFLMLKAQRIRDLLLTGGPPILQ